MKYSSNVWNLKFLKADKKKEVIILAVLVLLTFFLRIYNTSDLSGGDDSQWAELATYAIQDPRLIIYPQMPDEPIQWQGMHYSRPFVIIPYVISILLLGYTSFAVVFPAALFSALSVILLFLLLKKFFDKKLAWFACFLFAISPFLLAFSRIGILDASLIFYGLLAFWLLIKGLEEKRKVFIYLSALTWFVNMTTTDVRGVVPILAVLPCIYVYLMKKKFDLKKLLKNNTFHHFLISHIGILVLLAIYIVIPLAWGDSGWFHTVGNMVKHSVGAREGTQYYDFFTALSKMGSILIFTPFLGLIFIPLLSGIITAIRNIKKFHYSFWIFYFIGIIFFYMQGQFAPHRQTIFLPAIVSFAAIGIVVPYYYFRNRKRTYFLPVVLALSFSYLFFMLFMFSTLYAQEFVAISSISSAMGLGSLLNLVISYWWVFVLLILVVFTLLFWFSNKRAYFQRIRSIYLILIAVLLIINLSVSVVLVHSGVGIYKRTDSTGIVGDYLKQNLGDERYSCVAGVHSKSFSFYTQRTCVFWVKVDVPWLEEQVRQKNLKYFIINTHYRSRTSGLGNVLPNGELGPSLDDSNPWWANHYDKYDWLMENSVEITDKVGLKDSLEFKVYELKPLKSEN
jgi:4-amino-4-deoxy-L-arabinose transferase-like glycosyltransferase